MERFRNSKECLDVGRVLVQRERDGEIVPYRDAAEFAMDVIETMAQSPTIHRQLHDKLYKHVNKNSKIGALTRVFLDLALRSVSGRFNLDVDFEVISFKDAKIVGDELPMVDESYFREFIIRASQLELPKR
jgi:hypothetical protein